MNGFRFLRDLLREGTKESFTLFLSLTSGLAFLGVSFLEFYFCVVEGQPGWVHYESFSMWTAGGGIMAGLGNKIVNTHKQIKTSLNGSTSTPTTPDSENIEKVEKAEKNIAEDHK